MSCRVVSVLQVLPRVLLPPKGLCPVSPQSPCLSRPGRNTPEDQGPVDSNDDDVRCYDDIINCNVLCNGNRICIDHVGGNLPVLGPLGPVTSWWEGASLPLPDQAGFCSWRVSHIVGIQPNWCPLGSVLARRVTDTMLWPRPVSVSHASAAPLPPWGGPGIQQ